MSVFLHDANHVSLKDAKKKLQNCTDCHTVDPKNSFDIADFPDHDTCLRCHEHRQDFFRGTRPEICAICHTNVSPKNGDRFGFARPMAKADVKPIFPHDQHGVDVLTGTDSVAKVVAKKDGCYYCHERIDSAKFPTPAGWSKGLSPSGALMSVPGEILGFPEKSDKKIHAHADCSACHTKAGGNEPYLDPGENQCSRCHLTVLTTATPPAKPGTAPAAAGLNDRVVLAFLDAGMRWSDRVSATFVHSRDEHIRGQMHADEKAPAEAKPPTSDQLSKRCASCHVRSLTATSLRAIEIAPSNPSIPGADKKSVPIASCWGCHYEGDNTGQEIKDELQSRSKKPAFKCVYCHLPNVGARAVPGDHKPENNKPQNNGPKP